MYSIKNGHSIANICMYSVATGSCIKSFSQACTLKIPENWPLKLHVFIGHLIHVVTCTNVNNKQRGMSNFHHKNCQRKKYTYNAFKTKVHSSIVLHQSKL